MAGLGCQWGIKMGWGGGGGGSFPWCWLHTAGRNHVRRARTAARAAERAAARVAARWVGDALLGDGVGPGVPAAGAA